MARVGILAVLLAAVFTLASPLPSHAGFRSGFVAGFPVATFPRSHFVSFPGRFVVVNRPFVAVSPFAVPARRIFVREVIFAPVFVVSRRPAFFVSAPVFVSPVRPAFVSGRCFVDQFGLLRCFP